MGKIVLYPAKRRRDLAITFVLAAFIVFLAGTYAIDTGSLWLFAIALVGIYYVVTTTTDLVTLVIKKHVRSSKKTQKKRA